MVARRDAVQISVGGGERCCAYTRGNFTEPRWMDLLVSEAAGRHQVDFIEFAARGGPGKDQGRHTCVEERTAIVAIGEVALNV